MLGEALRQRVHEQRRGGGGIESLWAATAGSVNCAFVRLSTSVGQDKLIDLAHKMGVQQTRPTQNDQFLTLSIGTVEATPMEMATVMATIANGGVHHKPFVVQKVVGPDGKVLIDNGSDPGDEVLTKDVADCEANVLRGVVTGGTGGNANVAGQEIFGKTGTTDNRADAWFIGANPAGFGTAARHRGVVRQPHRGDRGAGFGGDSVGAGVPGVHERGPLGRSETGLPDPGPVCSRPGQYVNPDGGRGGGAPVYNSQLPTVSRLPACRRLPPPRPPPDRSVTAGHQRPRAGRMTNRFDDLFVLQEHDSALDRLRHQHDTLPERAAVTDTEARLATIDAALALVRTDRDGIDRREKALDDEASSLKTKADEVERKMYSGEISSPKELQAMQAEVEQLRSHQSDLETTELELMEQREPVDKKFAELTAAVAEHRAQLESACASSSPPPRPR